MQNSEELHKEMGLKNPNFDGEFNDDATQRQETIEVDLADIDLGEDAQLQREKDRAEQKRANDVAERKHKRDLAKERERANKEIAIEREREEKAFAYTPPVYDLSPGTIEALQQDVRIRGMKLRRDLNVSLKEDKQKWQALRSACCLHSANMTLDE